MNAIKNLTEDYDKIPNRTVYEKFDYAKFLKNNDKFENSIALNT